MFHNSLFAVSSFEKMASGAGRARGAGPTAVVKNGELAGEYVSLFPGERAGAKYVQKYYEFLDCLGSSQRRGTGMDDHG